MFCYQIIWMLVALEGVFPSLVTDVCKDTHDWCPLQPKTFCEDEVMKSLCKKTCRACLPPGCLKCEQRCDETTGVCLCRDGYTLKEDEKSCEDVDECAEEVNPCTSADKPTCHNFPGSFECLKSESACQAKGETNYYNKDTCCKQTSPTLTFGKCGLNVLNTVGKITGGKNSTVERWPWMVHISFGGDNICGGSLLNENWVVTAAHCVSGHKTLSQIKITVGVTNTSDKTETTRQKRKIKQVIVHEAYSFPNNDIALIELDRTVKWSKFVGPICLPNGNKPKVDEVCFATGYGKLSTSGDMAEVLQEVDLPIINTKICKEAFKDVHPINDESMICGGYVTGGKDACQGDSGGGYVCQRCDSCEFYLAGMTSFGDGCATPGKYGVYVNIEHFEEWIAKKISTITVQKSTCVKREWSRWGAWTACSKTCKPGSQSRFRFCLNGIAGQGNCIGERRETRSCNTHECTETTWSTFQPWSDCSRTCGDGKRTRSRTCLGESKTKKCAGKSSETKSCFIKQCDEWAAWKWSDCDRSCGGGKQVALRLCYAAEGCRGDSTTTRACNTKPCTDTDTDDGIGGRITGIWGPWSECSVICGTGTQTRTHSKTKKSEKRNCKLRECATWGTWETWAHCSKQCGKGTSERVRVCLHKSDGNTCNGPSKRTRPCNNQACIVPFSPWTKWSKCSKDCGKGKQTRTRKCSKGKVCTAKGEKPNTTESRECNADPCPVWDEWGKFGVCSKSCGRGSMIRSRSCKYAKGGLSCKGKSVETKMCNSQKCPTWGKWSSFGSCSKTCNKGTKSRSRQCVGGRDCVGKNKDELPCNTQLCPKWQIWEPWTECSETCGNGTRVRARECLNGNVGEKGCIGDLVEVKTCKLSECAKWSVWGKYRNCSKTCGSGMKVRNRLCIGGKPGDPGCPGNSSEEASCNTHPCPTWQSWSEWSDCSQTCGGGTTTRKRNCLNGKVGEEGCSGTDVQEKDCEIHVCPDYCSERCRALVENDYCLSGEIYNHGCPPACCYCEDIAESCALYSLLLGCAYECKQTCGMC